MSGSRIVFLICLPYVQINAFIFLSALQYESIRIRTIYPKLRPSSCGRSCRGSVAVSVQKINRRTAIYASLSVLKSTNSRTIVQRWFFRVLGLIYLFIYLFRADSYGRVFFAKVSINTRSKYVLKHSCAQFLFFFFRKFITQFAEIWFRVNSWNNLS